MADPTDAEIEAQLAAAPAAAWDELGAAADELAAEETHGSWAGGQVVETKVIDGVEREIRQMPYVVKSAGLNRVRSALGPAGAIVVFDWMAWDGAARFATADAVATASPADAARLLTAFVRGDRFNEGLLLSVADDGRLLAAIDVLRRWRQA